MSETLIFEDDIDVHASNDAVILSYSQNPVEYKAVPKVWLTHPDSTEEAPVLVPFTYGELLEDVEIMPDFKEGDMQISVPDGSLVKEATIIKPEDLTPENIRKGVTIGGIEGEFLGDTEEIEVELDMADGDQVILPVEEGKSFSKVTVKKPETLVAENIAAGVEIGGVTGTNKGGDGSGLGDYLVQVIDYDGTVLSQSYLNEGDVFTLPDGPKHDRFVFDGWSSPVDITDNKITVPSGDVTIGAMYHTASGATEIDIVLTKATGLTFTFLSSRLTGMASIDWGDGSTGNALTHTYSSYGEYTIKVYGLTAISAAQHPAVLLINPTIRLWVLISTKA